MIIVVMIFESPQLNWLKVLTIFSRLRMIRGSVDFLADDMMLLLLMLLSRFGVHCRFSPLRSISVAEMAFIADIIMPDIFSSSSRFCWNNFIFLISSSIHHWGLTITCTTTTTSSSSSSSLIFRHLVQQHVPPPDYLVGEIFEADVALKRTFAGVTANVVLEIVDLRIGLVAIRAQVRPLPQMHRFDVFGEQGLGNVALHAGFDVTDESPIVGVHFQVQRELRLRLESLGAELAEKGQLAGMRVQMLFEMLVLLVGLGTEVTLEGFFSRVHTRVNVEERLGCKRLLAAGG